LSQLFTEPADTPDDYLAQIKSTTTTILNENELAPMRRGTRNGGRKGARWLEREAIEAKKHRRQLERRWKKFGCECDRVAYRAACHQANILINRSRNRHRIQRIVEAGNNSRHVWSAVKDLLHSNHHDIVSTAVDDNSFCAALAGFFVAKVKNIKSAISTALVGDSFDPLSSDIQSVSSLCQFDPVTENEVAILLRQMPSKSSPLDFIPTSLLKSCSGTFAHIIAHLANLSFVHSTFPQKFKLAQVTPLLKKPVLTSMSHPVIDQFQTSIPLAKFSNGWH